MRLFFLIVYLLYVLLGSLILWLVVWLNLNYESINAGSNVNIVVRGQPANLEEVINIFINYLLAGVISVWGFTQFIWNFWVFPRALKRAKYLWASGAPIDEVLAASKTLTSATGEMGYQGRMLRSWACFAGQQRSLAVTEASSAHLARKYFWIRWPVRFCNWTKIRKWQWPEGVIQLLAPDLPDIFLSQVQSAIAANNKKTNSNGWKLLLDYIPHAADDPVFLEACMKLAMERMELNPVESKAPCPNPEAMAIFECSMNLLMRKHNDPRLPWDRVKLAG